MTIRELFVGLGFNVDKQSAQKAEQTIGDIKSKATKLLGAIGIGFSLTQIVALADEFNGINDQIRSATKELGDQRDIQKQVLAAANDTKTSYGSMADMVSKLVQEDKNLFGSDEEAAQFASLTTKLFKTAGKSDAEIQNIQEALNKSFAKGKVDTETLNRLYERAPEAINLISESLGVAKENLLDMATKGQLTCADLKNAFVSNADAINAGFEGLDYSISDALLNIRNQWGLWVDGMNSSLGVTQTVAKTMVRGFTALMDVLRKVQTRIEWLADKMGGADKLLRLLAITASTFLLAFNFQKIQSGLKSVLGFIGKIQLKTLAIIAVVILLALIVEDFIKFLQGENSVIGTIFDEAGIGSENARQSIFKAFGAVRDFVLGIFGEVRSFLSEHGDQIRDMFKAVGDAILQILSAVFLVISVLAKAVFGALQAFWAAWGDKVMAIFQLFADFLGRSFERAIEIIRQFAEFLSAIFSGDIHGALQSLLGIFLTILEQIIDAVKTIFTAIWTVIGDKVAAIKDAIVEGFQAAIDWITSLPDQAIQWGSDIIDGIVNGIKGAVGKVGEAAKGIADKITSFLHFSVPDEGPLKDYEKWMPDFMDGLARGVRKNAPKVLAVLETLTGDMSVITQSVVPSPKTVERAAGGNTSKVVTQNVEINNKFEGDRAGQQKSSEAMSKAADDSTAELARALQYAR